MVLNLTKYITDGQSWVSTRLHISLTAADEYSLNVSATHRLYTDSTHPQQAPMSPLFLPAITWVAPPPPSGSGSRWSVVATAVSHRLQNTGFAPHGSREGSMPLHFLFRKILLFSDIVGFEEVLKIIKQHIYKIAIMFFTQSQNQKTKTSLNCFWSFVFKKQIFFCFLSFKINITKTTFQTRFSILSFLK